MDTYLYSWTPLGRCRLGLISKDGKVPEEPGCITVDAQGLSTSYQVNKPLLPNGETNVFYWPMFEEFVRRNKPRTITFGLAEWWAGTAVTPFKDGKIDEEVLTVFALPHSTWGSPAFQFDGKKTWTNFKHADAWPSSTVAEEQERLRSLLEELKAGRKK